jgi:hypothetical protein
VVRQGGVAPLEPRAMGSGSVGATVGTAAGVAWRLPQAVGSGSMGSCWININSGGPHDAHGVNLDIIVC